MVERYRLGKLIYENKLSSAKDVKDFRLEGDAMISFPNGRLRLENARDPSEGQRANFVYWCPVEFPSDIAVFWEFYPVREPGLCMLFFAAKGRNGEDIFSPNLAKRTGEYEQYHHGDINTFHVSYFRRKAPEERAFHTCNLRKSYGFHLVCQGADPIPSVEDARPPYRMCLIKCGAEVSFSINELEIFSWTDDAKTYGPFLNGGKIGFRQMAPLIAEYANLRVFEVTKRNTAGNNPATVTQISAGWSPAVHAYFDLCPESPDGSKVLYFQYAPGKPPMGYVMVAELDPSGIPLRHYPVSELIPGTTHAGVNQQWIDNDTVAYTLESSNRSETVVYSLRTHRSRRLPCPTRMFCPANGLGLAIVDRRSSNQAIATVNVHSGSVRKLFTLLDAYDLHPLRDKIKDRDRLYFKHTKWTTDGKRFMVVFTNEGYQRPSGVILVKSIFVANADGSGLRYLAEFGHHPMWSYDGSFAYAFEFAGDGLLNLVAYPIDGRKPYHILNRIRGWHASLNPDGELAVTDVGRWEKPGQSAVLLYEVKTAKMRVLSTFALSDASHATGIHPHPVWSRDASRVYFNSAEGGQPKLMAARI